MHEQTSVPYGYCQCGCGEKTTYNKYANARRGVTVGYRAYVHGHNRRNVSPWVERDTGFTSPCWVWTGGKTQKGYGKTTHRGRTMFAHRAQWEDAFGPVPHGLQLDHLCRVRSCVNPAHLEPVSNALNSRRGANAKLTLAEAEEIRRAAVSGRETQREIAARYGISGSTVSRIKLGLGWSDE